MKSGVRIGFLGTGGIARAHLKNLNTMGNVEVTAACGRRIESAAAFLKDLPSAQPFDSLERMLDSGTIDALVVAIPPGAHDGQVELASERGVALFLEKPIALTVERARSQTLAIESSGVVNMVGYMNRFGRAVVKLKDLLDSGQAGRPTLFQGRYFCNSLHSPWWMSKEMAGGQIVEQIIHTFDLALHLFGDVASVSAFTENICHRDVPAYTVEDTSVTAIRFENGALATVAGSNCAIPGQWINDFRVVCENVTVDFSDSGHASFDFTGENGGREIVADDTPTLAEEMRVFVDCVRTQTQTDVPVREGFKGVALTAAIAQSAEEGGVPVEYL